MRGSKYKQLAAFIAEQSVPSTRYMSSNAASSSGTDNPGPLTSCVLDSSPSVRDASAETPSSCASLTQTFVPSCMVKEETLYSCRNVAERLHSLLFCLDCFNSPGH